MFDWFSDGQLAAIAGAFGGTLLGLAARLGSFCTLGAIEDFLHGDDDTRLRQWGFAIALGILGVACLSSGGFLQIENTFYHSTNWNPAGSALGGLAFGYGMALTGFCGHGALARLGGGDLRALVVTLIMGISAYMTMAGPIAVFRLWAFPANTSAVGIHELLGVPFSAAAIAIGGSLALWSLSSREFRGSATALWGGIVGLAICLGWASTAFLAEHGFSETTIRSHNFAAPTGETLIYLMTMTGSYIDFGIGSVLGVVFGAAIGSALRREFRWEACEDPRELRRQLFGAFLMGTGAVISLGCSVGQGLSAMSVLAVSAPIVLLAIFAGAALGLRALLIHGSILDLLKRG